MEWGSREYIWPLMATTCYNIYMCIYGSPLQDRYRNIYCQTHAYLTAWLRSSFLGDLDGLQIFFWQDALGYQRSSFLAPGSGNFRFPAARLTTSLTWRSAHRRGGIHCWVVHTTLCQRPKALWQHS